MGSPVFIKRKSGRECIIEIVIKKQQRNQETYNDVIKYFYSTQHYKTSVIQQSLISVNKVEDVEIKFLTGISPLDLLKKWCSYRIDIEVKCLNYKILKQKAAIYNTELLIFACQNCDIILNGLKNKDVDAYLIKTLKKSAEDVKLILQLPIRRLSKLDHDALKVKLKDQNTDLKALNLLLKDPTTKVIADIESSKSLFYYR